MLPSLCTEESSELENCGENKTYEKRVRTKEKFTNKIEQFSKERGTIINTFHKKRMFAGESLREGGGREERKASMSCEGGGSQNDKQLPIAEKRIENEELERRETQEN